MSISLRAMRYFTTAIEQGSISAAAETLNVSASAISSAIDQIEAHFQLQLADRRRARGVAATAAGVVMARKFQALLEDYQTILEDGGAMKRSLHGDLRIGYYAPIAPAFLPQILSDLMHPESALVAHLVECDNYAALEGLRAGLFDVIVFVAQGAERDMRFEPLLSAPAYCLMSADHRLAARSTIALSDLTGEEIVSLNRPIAADYYAELFETVGQQPRIIAHCTSTEMVRSLVGSRRACAVLNMLPLTDVSYAGDRLVARPITDDLPPLTLSVGYRTSRPRRAVTEFVARCKAYFAHPDPLICASPDIRGPDD